MESPNGNFIIKLTHLLENKRDGLIIIDGKWGTGKTFFIKNEFSRYYTHNAFYYISLLGVKTILDFKAKIIDCYYLKGIKSLQSGLETITAVGGISSGSPESSSVINGLLNSIGASVRENILSKLSGVFILDDIERITDNSLANEILTYCHSLYCESVTNNLDFIIISNTSSESELELHHKEKIISDSLHFNSTPEEILNMRLFEEKLSLLPAEDANIFREMAISYGIVNIRLLMRTLIISTPLYIYAAQHPEMA
ncbi:P-loop NTPase fold protein, partial [Enterobacter hormaechei]|uniref:P-loop NTPase fold protein n=2 Tax=Enterobacter TaxID=547 RepID=UPI0039E9EE6B